MPSAAIRSTSAVPTDGLPFVHWLVQSKTSTQVPNPTYAVTPPVIADRAGFAAARPGAAVTAGRGLGAVAGVGAAVVGGGGGGSVVVVVDVLVVVGSATAARSSGRPDFAT